MSFWTSAHLGVALIAATFGFGGLDGATASTAKVLFFVFSALSAVAWVMHMVGRRMSRQDPAESRPA